MGGLDVTYAGAFGAGSWFLSPWASPGVPYLCFGRRDADEVTNEHLNRRSYAGCFRPPLFVVGFSTVFVSLFCLGHGQLVATIWTF